MFGLREADDGFADSHVDVRNRVPDHASKVFGDIEMGLQSYEFPDPGITYIRSEVIQSALPLVRQINDFVKREGSDRARELFKCCIGEGLPYGGVKFEDFDSFVMDMIGENSEFIDELNLIRFRMTMAVHYLMSMSGRGVRDFKEGESLYFEMRDRFNICPTVSFYIAWLHKCSSKEERLQVYYYFCDADVGNRILFFNRWLSICESLAEFRSVFVIMAKEKVNTDTNTMYCILNSSLPQSKYWKLLKYLDEVIAENTSSVDSWWIVLRRGLDDFRTTGGGLN